MQIEFEDSCIYPPDHDYFDCIIYAPKVQRFMRFVEPERFRFEAGIGRKGGRREIIMKLWSQKRVKNDGNIDYVNEYRKRRKNVN